MFRVLKGFPSATGFIPLLALALSVPIAQSQTRTPDAGIINTVAGNGTGGFSGDGGQATSAEMWYPSAVAVDKNGNIYVADSVNLRIRELNVSTGTISTVAGDGSYPSSCDDSGTGNGGPATSAAINPNGVAVDATGDIYIADLSCSSIREVNVSTGTITRVAGGNGDGYSGDGGPATSAAIGEPYAVAVGPSGDLYIADYDNCVVRKVTASTGDISTIAGTGTCWSFSGSGIAATSADMSYLTGVAVDASGNVYIVDNGNFLVYKVSASTGVISLVAGNLDGEFGCGGDGGPATSAELQEPYGVTVDSYGNIYITDNNDYNSPCSNVREVSAATGDISTVVGGVSSGYSGDGGPASSSEVADPEGLAVDNLDNLYIADWANNVVRVVGASSILPVPPSDATSYGNLECWGLSGYSGYTGNPPNLTYRKEFWNDWTPFYGGGGGAGSYTMQAAQSVPDTGVCGSVETLVTSSSGEYNGLAAENVCGSGTQYSCPSSISGMELDMQFYIPPNTTYQALEFDPDVTWPDSSDVEQSYKVSVACEFHPDPDISDTPIWVYWDGAANDSQGAWEPFTQLGWDNPVDCNLTPGRHRLQLYVTLDTQDDEYYYNEMVVDGQEPFFNLAPGSGLGPITPCNTTNQDGACAGWGTYIGVEQQIDASHSNSTSDVCESGSSDTVCTYYDHDNLFVWGSSD